MEPLLREKNQDDGEAPSRRGAIVAVLVIIFLLVAALLLTQRLRRDAALQDCMAAGRTDCVRLTPGRQ